MFEFQFINDGKLKNFCSVCIKENEIVKFTHSFRTVPIAKNDSLSVKWSSHCVLFNSINGLKLLIGDNKVEKSELPYEN